MTQTPRGFDPQDPVDAPPAQYGGAGELPGDGSREEVPATGDRAGRYPEDAGTDIAPVQGTRGGSTPAADTGAPRPSAGAPAGAPAAAPEDHRRVTRAGMVWTAVAIALVVLILLIVFILQNQEYVQVKYFGLEGAVPLGVALFIAAVGGGVLVAIAGAARIIQLRLTTHRQRTRLAGQGTPKR